MELIESWYYSSDRYNVHIDYLQEPDDKIYVRLEANDKKADPDQKWSGHMEEMSEPDFCRFMYKALARHRGYPEDESPQEEHP